MSVLIDPSSFMSSSTARTRRSSSAHKSNSSSRFIPHSSLLSLLSSLPPSSSPSPSYISALLQLSLTLWFLLFSYYLLFSLPWFLLPVGWMMTGIGLSILYMIGNDCANGVWTKSGYINRVVGEVAMLPLLQPFECFRVQQSKRKKEEQDQNTSGAPLPIAHPISLTATSPHLVPRTSFLSTLESFILDFFLPTLPSSSHTTSRARTRLLFSVLLQYSYLVLLVTSLFYFAGGWGIIKYMVLPLVFYRSIYGFVWVIGFTERIHQCIPQDILITIPSYKIRNICQIIKKQFQQYTWDLDLYSLVKEYYPRIHWLHLFILSFTPIMSIIAFRYVELTGPTLIWSIVYYFFTGIGITAGYHRLFAHRSYEAHPIASFFLLSAATGALEGSAKWWCGGHRVHHRYTDTRFDPYNAGGGFWYAHLGWMLVHPKPENSLKADIKDLNQNQLIVLQHKYYLYVGPFMAFVFPTLIAGLFWNDWVGGYFYAGIVRLFFVHHSTFCVNSVAHYFGSNTFDDHRSPKDSLVTAFLTFGEGYHNFHHEYPNDYRNGINLFSYDPTKWLINFLSMLGLVSDRRQFPANEIEKGRVLMMEKEIRMRKQMIQYAPEPHQLKLEMTFKQVKQLVKEEGKELIIVNGLVHDLKGWVAEHPGGAGILKGNLGTDVTEKFEGRTGIYKHSQAAHHLLSTFRIARLVKEKDEQEQQGLIEEGEDEKKENENGGNKKDQ